MMICQICERDPKDFSSSEKPITFISTFSWKGNSNNCCSQCIEMLKIALDNNMLKMEVRRNE